MSPEETAAVLGALMAVYPSMEATEERVATWSLVLAPEDGRAILEAALRYMRTAAAFPPTPGQLIADVKRPPGGPTPAEAWEEVRNNIGRSVPVWSDPRIGRAAEAALGGWNVWAPNVLTENIPWDRARFIDAYQTSIERDLKVDAYQEAKHILDQPNPHIVRILSGQRPELE